MLEDPKYIVIAVTCDATEGDGRRIWSQEFRYRAAADKAYQFIREHSPETSVTVIGDNGGGR